MGGSGWQYACISAHVRKLFHLRLCELIDMVSDYHCGCEDCECDEECCHCELLSAALLRDCSELFFAFRHFCFVDVFVFLLWHRLFCVLFAVPLFVLLIL